MAHLPLVLDVQGLSIACSGKGARLISKAQVLLEQGARVHWFGDVPESLVDRVFSAGSLEQCQIQIFRLMLLELDDASSAQSYARQCGEHGVSLWLAGYPQLSSLSFPALLQRGPLRIALDTAGQFPALSRVARARLETWLPAAIGRTLERLAERFSPVNKPVSRAEQHHVWDRALSGDEQIADETVDSAMHERVALVGAGPGNPEFLTLRALRLIGLADVVLYDRLVSDAVLALVRRDAEKIHVGKQRANHSVPQTDIHELLIRFARTGKRVVRLKGGDPFIFGRGGEEAEALAEVGISCEVVPGITAASGCAAMSGIPLTHRDHAQSVRFVTGQLKNNTCDLPWTALVQPEQTLVFYMGLVGLPTITHELIAHGMSPDTLIALVSCGTTPEQKVLTGTLKSICDDVQNESVRAPTLIIVGSVVSVREKLMRGMPVAVN